MAIAPGTTLVDYLVPARSSRSLNLLRDLLLVIGFSVFLALCSQVSFHIPFTPVPITLQTLGVLLTGAALGSRRGALAMLAYLAEGAAGLPVFASGTGGIVHLLGYTGGYLWSYPIAAFVTGFLCERRLDRHFLTSVLAMLPGSLIIYALGVPWLAIVGIPTAQGIMHPPILTAIALGMLPFIPGDLLKLVIAAVLLPTAWSIVNWVKPEQRK
ncbi:MAG TPA: biotin transporter BioY [Ktedonobacteraceae bacterium]|nr:biotin transporter BioY [Ktedonobacteraceae bacterium]